MPSTPQNSRQPSSLETTPRKNNETGVDARHRSSNLGNRKTRLAMIGEPLSGKYEGPMDPQTFLQNFLPAASDWTAPRFDADIKEKFRNACSGKGTKGKKEAQANGIDDRSHIENTIYNPLIDAIEHSLPDLQLQLRNSSQKSTTVPWCYDKALISPDIPVYHSSNLPSIGVAVDTSKVEVFIECKSNEPHSGFTDTCNDKNNRTALEASSTKGKETRHQIAAYVGGIMASQFRTHCFAVEVCGAQARLLRYDHGGATVTSSFSVYQEPHLVEFFSRYNQADPTTRGHDPSVVRLKAGEPDADRIEDTRAKLGLDADDPVFKFTVVNEFNEVNDLSHVRDDVKASEKEKIDVFYGAKIVVKAIACPLGRSTRGFIVVDIEGNQRFLKDTWRVDLPELDTEGRVYRILHGTEPGDGTDQNIPEGKQRAVPYIPTVIASGDVKGDHQKTTSKALWGVEPGKERRYQHYRLVLKEIGKPLDEFEDQIEWLTATADAIEAHQKAYEIHRILHRDISVGNILIHEGRGLLIDWEFSKCTKTMHARQTERTGTWQFMSARLLLAKPGEDVPHTCADDLESFFHVTCYIALKHAQHKLDDSNVIRLLRKIFDEAWFTPGLGTVGGDGKSDAIGALNMRTKANFESGPTKDLIIDVEDTFHGVYEVRPSDEVLKRLDGFLNASGPYHQFDKPAREAMSWRERQEKLVHDWIRPRFRCAVKALMASPPAPRRVLRERLKELAVIPFDATSISTAKRTGDTFSQIETSGSSKRSKR